MDTGRLNRRITITTAGTLTTDGIGGFIEGTPTTKETWANVKQLSMKEQILFGLQTAFASYRFTFMYYSASTISEIKSITYEGRTFNVVSFDNADEAKRIMTVIANEQK